MFAELEGMVYHRTVTSILTGCLTERAHRTYVLGTFAVPGNSVNMKAVADTARAKEARRFSSPVNIRISAPLSGRADCSSCAQSFPSKSQVRTAHGSKLMRLRLSRDR